MSDDAIFKTIEQLDDARKKATLAKDIDKVEPFIGSSLRYVHGSGTDEDRDMYLSRLREGFYDYHAMDTLRRDFRRFGDTVFVHGDTRIHVVVNGTEKDFKGRYLQVWAKEGADWKMVAWQTTPLPAG